MTRTHDEEVNIISECNLLHDIINPLKRAKNLNSNYSPILHGCMNTRKGKEEFKNFCILLGSGCSFHNCNEKDSKKNTFRERCSDAVAQTGWKYHYQY